MALRLAHQITCNSVRKPGMLQCTSYCTKSTSPFRVLWTLLQPANKLRQKQSWGRSILSKFIRRSYVAPISNKEVKHIKQSEYCQNRRPIGSFLKNENRADYDKGYEEKDAHKHSTTGIPKKSGKFHTSPDTLASKLQPQKMASFGSPSYCTVEYGQKPKKSTPEQNEINKQASQKYNTAVKKLSKIAEETCKKYALEASKPKVDKGGNVYEVYTYFSKANMSKERRILPHLQPSNLKPYGTMEQLMFPVFGRSRSRQIVYPAEPKSKKAKARGNKPPASREYCTQSCDTDIPKKTADESNLESNKQIMLLDAGQPTTSAQKQTNLQSDDDLESISEKYCSDYVSAYKPHTSGISDLKYNAEESRSKNIESKNSKETNHSYSEDFDDAHKKYTFSKIDFNKPKPRSEPNVREVCPCLSNLQCGGVPVERMVYDKVNLKSNERMTVPWPSYSDTIKNHDEKLEDLITYPPLSEDRPKFGTQKELFKNHQKRTIHTKIKNVPVRSPVLTDVSLMKNSDNNRIKNNFDFRTFVKSSVLNLPHSANSKTSKTHSLPLQNCCPEPENVCPPKETCPPRADDGLKVKRKKLPKLKFSPCPCVNDVELDPGKPLQRLKKSYHYKEKARDCPAPPKCPPRADDGLQVKKKKLPKIFSADCPCIDPAFSDSPPLVRPKKRPVPPPPEKKCVEECECCNPRADEGLKVKKKSLPKIPKGNCPCVNEPVPDGMPVLKLKKRHVPPQPRKCPPPPKCPPRADDNYKYPKKTLPFIPPSDCPCVEPEPLKDWCIGRLPDIKMPEPAKVCPCEPDCPCERIDERYMVKPKKLPAIPKSNCPCKDADYLDPGTPLMRLKKTYEPKDKPWVCPEPKCPPRADDGLKVKSKRLPAMPLSDCPCIEKEILDVPPLPRLHGLEVKEPPKVCPCEPDCPCERVDERYMVKPKKLPPIPKSNCPCVNDEYLDPGTPLVRPKKSYEPKDKPWVCPEPKCPPRADDGLKLKQKQLPEIKAGDCPCIEQTITDVPPLKKLVKRPVKPKPTVCVQECPCCTPRADEGLKVKRKQLPVIKTGDCPCVNQPSPEDVPLLKLKKRSVKEQKRVCPKPPVCDRADENLLVTPKKLPKLKASSCPCIPEPDLKDVEPLKRLDLSVPEPPRVCPIEEPECFEPRADDNYKVTPKKLPTIKSSGCHCVNADYLDPGSPLKRLIKTYEPMDKPKVCPKPKCPPRADDGLKVKQKSLPIIHTGDCPCVEERPLLDGTPLKKPKKRPVKQKQVCEEECICCTPRADEGLKVKSKKLPKMTKGTCPPPPPPYIPDDVPLIKLRKRPVPPIKRICPKPAKCQRADDNYKVEKKTLPKIKAKCVCVDSEPPQDVPPLPRLIPRPVKEPERVCPCVEPNCPCPSRADDGLQVKKKCLPYIQPSKCPCVDEEFLDPGRPLPRLKKLPVPLSKRVCPKPQPCIRADDGMKISKKSLPKIEAGECPCIEHEIIDVPPLARLKKRPCNPCKKNTKQLSHCSISNANKEDNTLEYEEEELESTQEIKAKINIPMLEDDTGLPKAYIWMGEQPHPIPLDDIISEETHSASDNNENNNKNLTGSTSQSNKTFLKNNSESLNTRSYNTSAATKIKSFMMKGLSMTKPFFSLREVYTLTNKKTEENNAEEYGIINDPWAGKVIDLNTVAVYESPQNVEAEVVEEKELHQSTEQKMHFNTSPLRVSGLLTPAKDDKKQINFNQRCQYSTQCLAQVASSDPLDFLEVYKIQQPARFISTTNCNCEKKKKCPEEGKCPRFRIPGCAPRVREDCRKIVIHEDCCKRHSPYPSFSECKDDIDFSVPVTECPDETYKILQPKYPIIKEIELLKKIKPSTEPPVCPLNEIIVPASSSSGKCQQPSVNKMISNFADEHKSEVFTQKNDNTSKASEGDNRNWKDICEKLVKEIESKCKEDSSSKKKHCKKVKKCEDDDDDDEAGFEECKSSKKQVSCYETLEKSDVCLPKDKSLFNKICDYFKARPNCPSPEEIKQKRLLEDAAKAAEQAGLALCKKGSKDALPKPITDVQLSAKCKKIMTPSDDDDPLCGVEKKRKKVLIKPKCPSIKCKPPMTKLKGRLSNRDSLNSGCKSKRCFSTFHGLMQHQRRFYSNQQNDNNDNDPFAFINTMSEESLRNMDQKELAKKILAAVRQGIDIMKKSGPVNEEDPRYRVFKELETLSELELKDFDNIETHCSNMPTVRDDVRDSIVYTCDFLSTNNSENKVSEVNVLSELEEMKLMDAFQTFCENISIPNFEQEFIAFEDDERDKTERLQRYLDDLLQDMNCKQGKED